MFDMKSLSLQIGMSISPSGGELLLHIKALLRITVVGSVVSVRVDVWFSYVKRRSSSGRRRR